MYQINVRFTQKPRWKKLEFGNCVVCIWFLETLLEDKDEEEEEKIPLKNIKSVSYGSSRDDMMEKRGSDKTHSKEWTLPRKIKVFHK